ncbi:hypothetical protein Ciccas_008882 [Cichlidogyrus casuarinus]|uniref:G-protein coupled receptors family 1 profile domain-containing protein n=1 Tax=Cichlidogyrus casuarinus TaxID=1844966 RepID=A0ABD2PZJ3_9PLAT
MMNHSADCSAANFGVVDLFKGLSKIEITSLSIGIVGIIANLIVFITAKQSKFLQAKATFLVGHQALLNSFFCFISIITISIRLPTIPRLYTLRPISPYPVISLMICYLWVSRLLYWSIVSVSAHGLMIMALDRCLAVVRPVAYRSQKNIRNYAIIYAVDYALAFSLSPVIWLDTVHEQNCVCVSETHEGYALGLFGTKFYLIYGMLWLCYVFFLPVITMTICYSFTVYKFLGKEQIREYLIEHLPPTLTKIITHKEPTVKETPNAISEVVVQSNRRLVGQLLRAAISVTLLFGVASSVEAVRLAFRLRNAQPLIQVDATFDQIGQLLINFQALSPVIYCVLMRSFRVHMFHTVTFGFFKKFLKRQSSQGSSDVSLQPVTQTHSVFLIY